MPSPKAVLSVSMEDTQIYQWMFSVYLRQYKANIFFFILNKKYKAYTTCQNGISET